MHSTMEITKSEINSILFYQGSTNNIEINNTEDWLKDFYNVQNAYEAINTLLFDGFENEKVRMIQEKRKINTVLLDYLPELLKVYCNIFTAMCKYTFFYEKREFLYTYRSDRFQTINSLEKNFIPSFFSTTLSPHTDIYFHRKKGILLLDIEASSNILHLDINDILKEKSLYPNENEILFPPFLSFYKKNMVLNEVEKTYKDIDGNPPKAKYKLQLAGFTIPSKITSPEKMWIFKNQIMRKDYIENAKNVWNSCNMGKMPEEVAIKRYVDWKRNISNYLQMKYVEIYRNIIPKTEETQRREVFIKELSELKADANKKREKYDMQITRTNLALSFLQPMALFFLALSFNQNLELYMKVLSIIFSTLCMIITGISKSLSLEGKLEQRTATYLRLDELERDLRYETDFNEKNIEKYIERMKKIIIEDNSQCEKNVNSLVVFLESFHKEDINKNL